MDDVVIHKTESIQRCVKRAREEYAASTNFAQDFTHQDAAVLNVTRACEQAIDVANHLIRRDKLGIPKESRDSFDLLTASGYIAKDLATRLKRMVGFRNTVVHEYQEVNVQLVEEVVRHGLNDLVAYSRGIISHESRLEEREEHQRAEHSGDLEPPT